MPELGTLLQDPFQTFPHRVAMEDGHLSVSYGLVDHWAQALASSLNRSDRRDQAVGLYAPRSISALVAVLAILRSGRPYLPLDPSWPRRRLADLLESSGLVEGWFAEACRNGLPQNLSGWWRLEEHPGSLAEERLAEQRVEDPDFSPTSNDLAYLLFTSGSTGRPKGVAMVRGALANLLSWQVRRTRFHSERRTLQFTALPFDVSFQEIFATWVSGGTLLLVDETRRRDPRALWHHLESHRVERLFLPFVALQQLAEAQERAPRSLQEVITAGEQLRVGPALRRFFSSQPDLSLENQYGPTEAHVVTFEPLASNPSSWARLPAIGRPLPNSRVRILGRRSESVPLGAPGELHLGGVCLARGYLGQPVRTAERFVPDGLATERGARLYRTGDLARFLPDGRLEYLGRIDQQLKIRGFRVEPGEVEAALARHPQVREVAVVARRGAQGDALVACTVLHEPASNPTELLRPFLEERLPQGLIPSFFVQLSRLPLTGTGKVDRRALMTESIVPERGEIVRPRTPEEEVMAGIWTDVLGVDPVGVEEDFFSLGGHSLLAVQVLARIRETFQRELPVRALFEASTVAQLTAHMVRAGRTQGARELRPLPRPMGLPTPPPPLSFAQERLWFLDQVAPGNAFYNFPLARTLRGRLRVSVLERALNEIVRRHEVLRSHFPRVDGQPVQAVQRHRPLALPVVDLRCLHKNDRDSETARLAREEAHRPFDLSKSPSFRSTLLLLDRETSALLLTLHHIVADGWSVGVLMRELSSHYQDFLHRRPLRLAPPLVQYADYAVWQREGLRGSALDESLAWWSERLERASVLALPTDRPRSSVPRFRGGRQVVAFGSKWKEKLEAVGRRLGATLFMTCLAVCKILLQRLSGQTDVVVGSPIANRRPQELESLIGFFVNTLALRTDFRALDEESRSGVAFEDLVRSVRTLALGAYSHQDLPFEKLVAHLDPERDLSRNPLFQVAFMVHRDVSPPPVGEDLHIEALAYEVQTTRIDLELHLWESPEGLTSVLYYDRSLFDATTVARWHRHFGALLEVVTDNPGGLITDFSLLGPAERQQLLLEWNDTSTRAEAEGPCIHHLVGSQAETRPDAVAVVDIVEGGHERHLSFGQLHRLARNLARRLEELGVGPEDLVAVTLSRRNELIWAFLGILESGAAYLPVDLSNPEERRREMLEDAAPRALLVLGAPEGVEFQGPTIDLAHLHSLEDSSAPRSSASKAFGRPPTGSDRHLAYGIFTSGSTGVPKRVMVEHRSLVHLVRWYQAFFAPEPGQGITQVAPAGFDHAVWEVWNTLTSGATLHLVPRSVLLAPEAYWEFLSRSRVRFSSLAASLAENLLLASPKDLPMGLGGMMVGGERLHRSALRPLPFPLYNCYGPSEVTVHATTWEVRDLDKSMGSDPPVGWPMTDVEVHVLDSHLAPQPLGAVGELWIGGAGLARGYHARPAATAERFLPNPFGSLGTRLYRTGDLARRRADGVLEFVGRVDHQVKIRGVRVELGEIEATLARHPAVDRCAATIQTGQDGSARLIAYAAVQSEVSIDTEESQERVDHWQTLYDQNYAQSTPEDPSLDLVGWNSSLTGEPIPEAAMREWVETTVDRIERSLANPSEARILEIGCGTGLLLWRLAPKCAVYVGTDFSPTVLEVLEQRLVGANLGNVHLHQARADEFRDLESQRFDAVVVNSVAQYFPSLDYFLEVLKKAWGVLDPGGFLFLGDLRNLRLHRTFCTAAELASAPDELPTEALAERVRRRILLEEELLLDPQLFSDLSSILPGLHRAQTLLRRGSEASELTQYRYDALLFRDDPGATSPDVGPSLPTLDLQVRTTETPRDPEELLPGKHRLDYQFPG